MSVLSSIDNLYKMNDLIYIILMTTKNTVKTSNLLSIFSYLAFDHLQAFCAIIIPTDGIPLCFYTNDLGKSELDIIKQYIGLNSPLWPEIGQRIILLNSKKLHKTVDSNSISSSSGPNRLLNYLLFLAAIVVQFTPVNKL